MAYVSNPWCSGNVRYGDPMELWDGKDADSVKWNSARAVDSTPSSIDEAIDDEFSN